MSISKSVRQIEVYRFLTQKKRARTTDIIEGVASRLGFEPQDGAFKRAVHRDLRALLGEHLVGVDYFTPAGDSIEPGEEDKFKNIRAEYYILSVDGNTSLDLPGINLLREQGGDLIARPEVRHGLCVSKRYSEIGSQSFYISFEVKPGVFLHLWTSCEDRPLKVIFARNQTRFNNPNIRRKIKEQLDPRSVLLLLPNPSVSRFDEAISRGHCNVEFKELDKILVEDKNSSNGTKINQAESVSSLFFENVENEQTTEPIAMGSNWNRLKGQVEMAFPLQMSLGRSHVFLDKK